MSRPRRYFPQPAPNRQGLAGWVLFGECLRPECGYRQPGGRWGRSERGSACGHLDEMPGWWPTRELAVRQAELWRRAQSLILAGDGLGPVAA